MNIVFLDKCYCDIVCLFLFLVDIQSHFTLGVTEWWLAEVFLWLRWLCERGFSGPAGPVPQGDNPSFVPRKKECATHCKPASLDTPVGLVSPLSS